MARPHNLRGGAPPGPRPNRRKQRFCARCGANYTLRKASRYCSATCGKNAALDAYAARGAPLEALEGLSRSPITKPDERHHAAREWRLISPDGEEHVFRNLCLFVRQHPHLFEVEDLVNRSSRPVSYGCRAVIGLSQLRPEKLIMGRRRVTSWKEWRWLD